MTARGSTVLAIEGVTKRFGSNVALDGVDLTVPSGCVFGLLGTNGAGKTTLIRILTTILRPDSGRAFVLGHDVVREAPAVRRQIGLAGQLATVDEHLTARENLRLIGVLTHLPRGEIRRRSDELIEVFGLGHASDRPVRTYSGGMRRRLDLAAAVIHRPPLLFLDEPTTGLDPASRTDFWRLIEDITHAGSSVILTTQYLEEADRLARHLAVIDAGRIIAEGTAAQLKARLDRSIVDIRVEKPDKADRLALELSAMGAGDARADGDRVEVLVGRHPDAVLEVLQMLRSSSVDATSLVVREPTLDDVFMELTSRVDREIFEEVADGARTSS